MSSNFDVRDTGNTLLKAYVSLKAGETKKAMKLFSSLKYETGLDPIMDGVAKAMMRLQAMDDEESFEDEDMGDEDMGDEEDMGDDEGFDEEEEVEVPASVAKFLNLR